MIWELAQDHKLNQTDPLLAAIKQALATPGNTAIQRSGQSVDLSFISAPLGSYRVQWTANLPQTDWNTLMVTNVTGTGGVLRVPDPAATQASKFYRVKTPP